jgi:hypothetical protein
MLLRYPSEKLLPPEGTADCCMNLKLYNMNQANLTCNAIQENMEQEKGNLERGGERCSSLPLL